METHIWRIKHLDRTDSYIEQMCESTKRKKRDLADRPMADELALLPAVPRPFDQLPQPLPLFVPASDAVVRGSDDVCKGVG